MVFHRSLSDCKSFQYAGTLLSILADLGNAVVQMVSVLPPISNSSSPFYQVFGDDTLHTIYNWFHFHFHDPLFVF